MVFGLLDRNFPKHKISFEIIHFLDGNPNFTETVFLFQSELDESEGKAETSIEPGKHGRVAYQGSYWKARSVSLKHIHAKDKIRVLKRHGITLWVIPASN